MITINRRIFLFELFSVIMFFCQYRIANKQGYILFFFELVIGCICWLGGAKKNEAVPKSLSIYFSLIIYEIILTLMVSNRNVENVKHILYIELGMLFLCYFLVDECSNIAIIKRIREFGLVMSLLGCYEFATHSSIFARYITVESRIYTQSSDYRVQTIFMHPTICGVFMVLSWLCVVFIPYKKVWINYVAKVSIILCLLGTQARSAWVAFAIINILYICEKYMGKSIRLKRRTFIQICCLVVVGLIIAICFRESINIIVKTVIKRWLDGMDSNNAANYNRMTMIKMGLQEWMSLGIGRKIFGSGNRYTYELLLTHPIRGWRGAVDNQYLTILLDFGLVGITFLFVLMYHVFKKTITSDNEICKLCGLCLLSMFISGFFYEMFTWIFVTLVFCLLLCILEKNTSKE